MEKSPKREINLPNGGFLKRATGLFDTVNLFRLEQIKPGASGSRLNVNRASPGKHPSASAVHASGL
jgi:hypothetical protein